MSKINFVDICCGLNWGDEAKGKLVSQLAKSGTYDFVCRWAGGNNAGHTIYINGKRFKIILGTKILVSINGKKIFTFVSLKNSISSNKFRITPKA